MFPLSSPCHVPFLQALPSLSSLPLKLMVSFSWIIAIHMHKYINTTCLLCPLMLFVCSWFQGWPLDVGNQLGCLVLGSLTFQLLAVIPGQITSYSGKSFPAPTPCRLLHMFAPIRFWISGFKLKSLIYLELIFVKCGRYGSNLILLQVGIIFPVPRALSLLVCGFGIFVKYQITAVVCAYIWIFIFRWYPCLFLCQYHAVLLL